MSLNFLKVFGKTRPPPGDRIESRLPWRARPRAPVAYLAATLICTRPKLRDSVRLLTSNLVGAVGLVVFSSPTSTCFGRELPFDFAPFTCAPNWQLATCFPLGPVLLACCLAARRGCGLLGRLWRLANDSKRTSWLWARTRKPVAVCAIGWPRQWELVVVSRPTCPFGLRMTNAGSFAEARTLKPRVGAQARPARMRWH